MKLIIQIPCYNEAGTLAIALGELPREVQGFDTVEWLIIDDGSVDETVEVAKANGVDHIVRHTRNRGLAYAFMTGIDACLQLGADVIVNTDADNQYSAACIPALTAPVVLGSADMAIGARPIREIEHFSPVKKVLQRLGSWVVRITSRTDVADAPSGFRAFSSMAARRFVLFNSYTYTLETIIQAGRYNLSIVSVPVEVNGDLRPSRLVKSIPSYINRSILTIIRIFVIYRPARFFGTIAAFFLGIAFLIGLRFLYYFVTGDGDGHVQSLILAGALLVIGFVTILVSFLADVVAANRRLLEDIRFSQKSHILRADVTKIEARDLKGAQGPRASARHRVAGPLENEGGTL
ncbi:Glycosyltransferase involved in cell wall biogenesis-like protein [Fulvimarina pelagi HTCC2506]|uniref:Glycosyltransferase involved in cell wall biogenesis-like protein n=1 Tax=Fulvimarina pelagi HTCC2506 TaxID=314231 RepID=Q0FYL5_9HYPH|nr:glycosyltransferase family 2 protein [Fulvimarina pelagi]EAU39980.1 Glycosyltransferase involved in cell wall biogenesis-like protein [Fulvimarina pelagi HTCC2506]